MLDILRDTVSSHVQMRHAVLQGRVVPVLIDTVARLPLYIHETRGLSCGRIDCVEAVRHRVDAIDATWHREDATAAIT